MYQLHTFFLKKEKQRSRNILFKKNFAAVVFIVKLENSPPRVAKSQLLGTREKKKKKLRNLQKGGGKKTRRDCPFGMILLLHFLG